MRPVAMRHWHGAGAAASALIEAEKLKRHYGPDIAVANITPQQEAAHHAYFGGRIELLKQGFMEGGRLHVYDIASAYPAAMVGLPSLAGGSWVRQRGALNSASSLSGYRGALRPPPQYRCSKSSTKCRLMRGPIETLERLYTSHSTLPTGKREAAFFSLQAGTVGTYGMMFWPQSHGLSILFLTSLETVRWPAGRRLSSLRRL